MTWTIGPPPLRFSEVASAYYAIWKRFEGASEATVSRAADELLNFAGCPATPEEERWVCDVLLCASKALATTQRGYAAQLARKAVTMTGTSVQLEITARSILGNRLANAGELDSAATELRHAVDLSYKYGPLESRLLDLSSLCGVLRRASRHEETIASAKELLAEARGAGKAMSIVVAFEFLGDAYAARGDWHEVLSLAAEEGPVIAEHAGRASALAAQELERRVARARSALGEG